MCTSYALDLALKYKYVCKPSLRTLNPIFPVIPLSQLDGPLITVVSSSVTICMIFAMNLQSVVALVPPMSHRTMLMPNACGVSSSVPFVSSLPLLRYMNLFGHTQLAMHVCFIIPYLLQGLQGRYRRIKPYSVCRPMLVELEFRGAHVGTTCLTTNELARYPLELSRRSI